MAIPGIFSKTIRYPSLTDVSPEPLALLRDAWIASKKKGNWVLSSDFDLSGLKAILPNLALLRLQHDPMRAKYEIVGPKLVKLLGRDPNGLWLDQVYPDDIKGEIHAAIRAVCDEGNAQFFVREYRVLAKRFGYRRLMLPLYKNLDDPKPTRVIVGIYPTSNKLKEAEQWRKAVKQAGSVTGHNMDRQHGVWEQQLRPLPAKPHNDSDHREEEDTWMVD